MKKIVLSLLLLSMTAPLFAAHTQSRPFLLSYPDMMYMYWNDADQPQPFRVYVKDKINGKPADRVTLMCNNNPIIAKFNDWTTCDVNPHKPVSIVLQKENFVNGAEGRTELWDFHHTVQVN